MTSEEAYEKWLDSPNLPKIVLPLDAFRAAWRMAGEEAAKLVETGQFCIPVDHFQETCDCDKIATAIRAHFARLTNEEPK